MMISKTAMLKCSECSWTESGFFGEKHSSSSPTPSPLKHQIEWKFICGREECKPDTPLELADVRTAFAAVAALHISKEYTKDIHNILLWVGSLNIALGMAC